MAANFVHPVKLYSRLSGANRRGISKLDARSQEGRLWRSVKTELVRQIAARQRADLSLGQLMLVNRCAWLSVKIALLDAKVTSERASDFDSTHYLAWSNTLRRTLAALGLEPTNPIGLADMLRKQQG